MKRPILILFSFLYFAALTGSNAANNTVQPNTWIKVATDRPDATYKTGEKVIFSVTIVSNAPAVAGDVAWTLSLDGAKVLEQGTVSLASGVATVEGSLDQPGVLQLKVLPKSEVDKLGTGMAGAAYDPYKIEPTAKLPADFEEFWNAQKAELAKIPLDANVVPVAQENANIELFEVSFANIKGLRSHGYLAKPKGAARSRL